MLLSTQGWSSTAPPVVSISVFIRVQFSLGDRLLLSIKIYRYALHYWFFKVRACVTVTRSHIMYVTSLVFVAYLEKKW